MPETKGKNNFSIHLNILYMKKLSLLLLLSAAIPVHKGIAQTGLTTKPPQQLATFYYGGSTHPTHVIKTRAVITTTTGTFELNPLIYPGVATFPMQQTIPPVTYSATSVKLQFFIGNNTYTSTEIQWPAYSNFLNAPVNTPVAIWWNSVDGVNYFIHYIKPSPTEVRYWISQ